MPKRNPLYLIDASVYIFRAYFSIPESMRDSAGRPVNALYGFTDFLTKFLAQTKATHAAAFFDESLTTSFRNDFFPEYKANRALPPEDLKRQLQLCREVASLLGLAEFADNVYEADDLIGTAMKKLRRSAKFRFVIVTSDKDLAQLIVARDGDELWDYAKDVRYNAKAVREKFGVPPEAVADYLALAGDAVDNVPGLKGIGAKTAATLLAKYGSLEQLLKHPERIVKDGAVRGAEKIARTLSENADEARLYRRVTEIAVNAPVSVTEKKLRRQGPRLKELRAFFEREGFGLRLYERIEKELG